MTTTPFPYVHRKHNRQCLKCGKMFKTIDPKHNRICPKCTIQNLKEAKQYRPVDPEDGSPIK